MSIFRCTKCGCIENTALSNYFWNVYEEKKPALCSECDPEIAKWHGEFPKATPESEGYVTGPDGFLYRPDDDYLKRLLAEKAEKEGKSST